MNVQDYRANGYNLSQYIDDATVQRAEREVTAAYLVPLVGDEVDVTSEPEKSVLMSLAFLLIQQRSISATRAGGKTKNTPQSSTPTADDMLTQAAKTAAFWLNAIDKKAALKVSDICGIFFKTRYFYIN